MLAQSRPETLKFVGQQQSNSYQKKTGYRPLGKLISAAATATAAACFVANTFFVLIVLIKVRFPNRTALALLPQEKTWFASRHSSIKCPLSVPSFVNQCLPKIMIIS